jgi:hypothetical protein
MVSGSSRYGFGTLRRHAMRLMRRCAEGAGAGKFTFANKSVYTGPFVEDKKQGSGEEGQGGHSSGERMHSLFESAHRSRGAADSLHGPAAWPERGGAGIPRAGFLRLAGNREAEFPDYSLACSRNLE